MLRTFWGSNRKKVRTFSLSPKLRRPYIKKSIPLSTLYNSCECSLSVPWRRSILSKPFHSTDGRASAVICDFTPFRGHRVNSFKCCGVHLKFFSLLGQRFDKNPLSLACQLRHNFFFAFFSRTEASARRAQSASYVVHCLSNILK